MTGSRISLVNLAKVNYFCKDNARAAVVLDKEINYWPIDTWSTRDLAVVALELLDKVVYVALCYMDITLPIVQQELDELVDYCHRTQMPLVIGMDANAHSTTWGEIDTNRRGETLDEWLIVKGLIVNNKGRVPTFVPDNGSRSTIIDLTISNIWADEKITDWTVETKEASLSDHRKIMFKLAGNMQRKTMILRRYKSASWREFKDLLAKRTDKVLPEGGLDDQALYVQENLVETLDAVAPAKAISLSGEGTKWWNDSLAKKRLILKNLYHERTLIKYRELKKDFTKELTRARKRSWEDFCSKAESAKDISKLVQIMERTNKRQMSLLQKEEQVLSPVQSIKHLLETHFPDGTIGDSLPEERPRDDVEDFSGCCQYITTHKVKASFKSFGDYKSPGPDELPPIALKHLDDAHVEMICLLFKRSIATGRVPEVWRRMKVTFIPKMGKDDYSKAKAYRPITLSNFILKGLERLVQWFILEHVLPRPLGRQHAYTKGRSCDSALSTFVNDVERAVHNGQYMMAVSLDCSGAFDCIKFTSARKCMARKNFPTNIIQWYENLLSGRLVTASIQGENMSIVPARGSPQGGVLSPLVWNVIMDSLLTGVMERNPVKILGYADDILLHITGTDLVHMAELLQNALNKVGQWGDTHGLMFNPTKTNMIVFTHRRKTFDKPRVLLRGSALELSDSIKYLGVEIQKNLSWTRHITSRTNNCRFLLVRCRDIVRRNWGLSPGKMSWIFKAIVRPKLTYGAVVWANGLKRGDLQKIKKIQRLALLSISQPLRSTPTAGLEAMMGWIPLDLHAIELGLNTYIRNSEIVRPTWDGIGNKHKFIGHLGLWKKMTESILPPGYPTERSTSTLCWTDSIAEEDYHFEVPLHIYTDASKEGDNVGFGWAAFDNDYQIAEGYESAKEIDVYQAETLAIKEALHWLLSQKLYMRSSIIWSDSLSAVLAINGCEARTAIVRETMLLLKTIRSRCVVDIKWVKGHSNVPGNDLADMLAKEGVKRATNLCSVSPYLPISRKTIKTKIRKKILEMWQTRWESLTDHKISRLFMPEVHDKKKHLEKMSLGELHLLAQIITGHGLFKRHLRHWIDMEQPNCALCEEDWESSWHLWAYCPFSSLIQDRLTCDVALKNGAPYERVLLKYFKNQTLKELMASNEAIIES